jgi:hypothetical protein
MIYKLQTRDVTFVTTVFNIIDFFCFRKTFAIIVRLNYLEQAFIESYKSMHCGVRYRRIIV